MLNPSKSFSTIIDEVSPGEENTTFVRISVNLLQFEARQLLSRLHIEGGLFYPRRPPR
ncbi:hypothetical protein BKA82DRAFT_1008571 [Pisolithus tinctorius]|uniref:Uncharacterized protein n=1 Tax=Pisolithus tinctorius Marx 270 TaxID=870435 RepID=A0A0C3NF19_PISTI|nr:hypothetical protein BKA82DRAFT_1008571 [Pisolithus tinctorius]KIN94118.1 hypothetical protein M404DRAFT_1008571 [Pisolithus tinctorius Marx 270]